MENDPKKGEPEGIPSPLQMRRLPVSAKVDIEVHNFTSKNVPPFIEGMAQLAIYLVVAVANILAYTMDGWAGVAALIAAVAANTAGAVAIIEHSVTKHHERVSEHYKGPKALPPEVLDIIRNIGKK